MLSKSNRKDSFSLFRYWRFALQKHGSDQKFLLCQFFILSGFPHFCPKAVKSSIGIIVHLKYILSFRFAQRNNLIVLENRTDYADSFLITWLLHDYGVSGC